MTSAAAAAAKRAGLRVMIVDDSAVIRGLFRRMLEAEPDIEVVATLPDGQAAVDAFKPGVADVIVLDIEMPRLDGLAALPEFLKIDPEVKVIMASTLTQRNARISLDALRLGAADYVAKPTARHEIHSSDDFKRAFVEKIRALGGLSAPTERAAARPRGEKTAGVPVPAKITLRPVSPVPARVLAIGSSTGGPQALINTIRQIKSWAAPPILITQHMPATFTELLAQHVAKVAGRACVEGYDGAPLTPGAIYVAPGGKHMLVSKAGAGASIRLDDGPAENFCKPAVDPMLRSLVRAFGGDVLAVILTGMGQDGLIGARALVEAGGNVIAQDQATSVVWGMPGAVATGGLCCAVASIDRIGQDIMRIAGGTKR